MPASRTPTMATAIYREAVLFRLDEASPPKTRLDEAAGAKKRVARAGSRTFQALENSSGRGETQNSSGRNKTASR